MANFTKNYLVERGVENTFVPRFVKVRQKFDTKCLTDFDSEIKRCMKERGLYERIKQGQRVAISAGSRQIANIPEILKSIVEIVKSLGGKPFIIPAMGSHGGATAEGQKSILISYGITEEAVGAPIISCMDVGEIGKTKDGIPVYCSKTLADADAIIIVNRIKPHPGLSGPIQSGLIKMSVIGLGKQKGAETCHRLGLDGMTNRLGEMSKIIISKIPIIFGVGILETANDETAEIHCVPAELFDIEEPLLLKKAQEYMPEIMFDSIDVLVVDEVGKNISGVCADPAITLRFLVESKKTPRPAPKCFIMSDLTSESAGAASGIGQADIITYRLYEKIDFGKTYVNSMTSTFLPNARMPIVMKNDYYALKLAIKTCNCPDVSKVRVVRIKNTLNISDIFISEGLFPEALANSRIDILSEPIEQQFDISGNYINF